MKTFNEWMKENMHVSRPYGQMGPDGRIYGYSSGSIGKIPGTGTWKSNTVDIAGKVNSEAEGLWKANSLRIRLGYLSEFPDAEKMNLHKMDWKDLPSDAKIAAARSMFSRSPFKEM